MAVKEKDTEAVAVSEEKNKALKLAIEKIEKDFGKGSIMKRFETPNEMLNFNKRFRKLKEEKVNILTKN